MSINSKTTKMSKEREQGSASAGLMEGFAGHRYEEWRRAAEELLKGVPFEKVMITRTYEGFNLQPLYMRDGEGGAAAGGGAGELPGQGRQVRGARASGYLKGAWLVSQELAGPDPRAFNEMALAGLEGGQTELNVLLDSATRAGIDPDAKGAASVGMCGLSLATREDMASALKGVHLDAISSYWRAGAAAVPVAALFFAYAKQAGYNLKSLRGCIETDPIAYLVEHGSLPYGLDRAYDEMAALTKYAAAVAPEFQTIGVQGHVYHNGGSSSAQEMAFVLATGVAYLRALIERGVSAADAARRIRLSLSVGPNFFIEIGKFRAMRQLWNRVLDAFEVAPEGRVLHVHARTGLWNKTVLDPYVNMLRVTTEAFAAVVGGCDSLHVSPFDEIVRETDTFSRRIARNVHHILAEECEMTRVVDPAGGSWAVETLTREMAESAWKIFQEVEAAGGIVEALRAGQVQSMVAGVSAAKRANLEQRRDVLVGSNLYPNAGEKPLDAVAIDYARVHAERSENAHYSRGSADKARVDAALRALSGASAPRASGELIENAVAAASAGATLGQIFAALGGAAKECETVTAIALSRGAEPFEKLRAASARHAAKTGTAPLMFQANIGPSRRYRMRADWTTSFFQVGGFKVLGDDDFDTTEQAVAAAAASGARMAVITSDDETYAKVVPELARALKAKVPGIKLLVAGAPGEHESLWREAGVDAFVNVRVNAYSVLKDLLADLNVL